MNVIVILILALIAYVFGYFVYARYISHKLGVDDARVRRQRVKRFSAALPLPATAGSGTPAAAAI